VVLCLALVLFAGVGAWLTSSFSFFVASVSLLAVAWLLICGQHQLFAYSTVLLIFMTCYPRLQLGGMEVEGPGTRGSVFVGDLLWMPCLASLVIRYMFLSGNRFGKGRVSVALWLMAPFVLLFFVLPVVGVSAGHWPISYVIPSFRLLEWAGFGFASFLLCECFGREKVSRWVIRTLTIAAILNSGYGLIQLGYSFGLLGSQWISLDTWYGLNNSVTWFFYPRATGLLVNPNSYGMVGTVFFIVSYSLLHVSRPPVSKWTGSMLGIFGTFIIVTSASRSALVGAGVAFLLLSILGIARAGKHSLRALAVLMLMTAGTVVLVAEPELLPDAVTERYITFVRILDSGVTADNNAVARTDMWREVWGIYTQQYPLGTGVAPTYVTGIPIDSYYFTTLLQGTLFFTFTFALFIFSIFLLGMKNHAGIPSQQFQGSVLVGLAAFVAAGSLTLSPLLEPWISAALATYIGLNVAECGVSHGGNRVCKLEGPQRSFGLLVMDPTQVVSL